MASKTPTTTTTTSGYVNPHKSVYGGVNAVDAALITNGSHFGDVSKMKLTRWYFADVDDTDTWDSSSTFPPPPHAIAVAWQPDQANTDKVGATITTQGEGGTDTVITFDCENANSNGWLWVLSRG